MAQNWVKLEQIRNEKLTPMMRQYLDAKSECGDSILFFRMGDFYEMFFDDAIEAADLLGLTLTTRDGSDKENRIPMAGVPYRSVDTYLARLIKAGRTVAICDQIEDPREAKGIVKRAVTRTVTPGTVLEPELLDETTNNYLCAVVAARGSAGIAFVDASTGEFLAAEISEHADRTLADELARTRPAEILLPESTSAEVQEWIRRAAPEASVRLRDDDHFDSRSAQETILDHYAIGTVKGLDLEDGPAALGAVGAILSYVRDTYGESPPRLRLPRRFTPSGYVVLDGNTQRNLELVESMAGRGKKGTLLDVLDKTVTNMGGRLLRQWILRPLVDVEEIAERLDGVEELLGSVELRLKLRDLLKTIGDLERLLGRITSKTANAREVKTLGRSLERVPLVISSLSTCSSALLTRVRETIDPLEDVAQWVEAAIVEEPPLALNEGNLLKTGYDADLDAIRKLVTGGRDWIATLQREESERTRIPKLKVGYNKVFGYYIEVSKSYADNVPDDYQRKQTLVNAERFVIPALKQREEEILTAQERMEKLEYKLFCALRDRIAAEANRIQQTASSIASLDVLLSLADVASTKGYCKPIVDHGDEIEIHDGRHPVVEDLMSRGDFVPNDTRLGGGTASLQIVTGPNMAGKSTYLRQVALVTLMAQIGSYVPAENARIGVVDRIFTRVGASDNLVRGESTFMVEMIETASILNSATVQSLLVLDEIGRGTSTFDGISIAWSVAEHIHDHVGAKTLFATHYHELTELATQLARAKNLNVAVREWGGKVVFLYRIVDGGADHSYGIQVAKLAGLPPSVIQRARDVLETLESGNAASLGLSGQMYLFGPAQEAAPSKVESELEPVDVDEMSPREAHDFLRHLKDVLKKAQSAE